MMRNPNGAVDDLEQRVRDAIAELQAMISRRYPTAVFQVARDLDEPANVLLKTILGLDDPDDVFDLVSERLLELQVDERVPVHVIPLRTPKRVLASMNAREAPGRRLRD